MITKNNTLKVMELFFKNPERKFHLRELERLTGLSMPGVRKIVLKLEKEDLLCSERAKMVKNFYASRNEKFIQVKRAYNLYSVFESGFLNFSFLSFFLISSQFANISSLLFKVIP